MYLLAILNNIKCVNNKFSVSGNEPRDAGIKKMFIESGFYSYVKYKGNQPLTKNTDTIQILTGYNTDTNLAKQMSDFAIAKMNVSKSQCRFLYIMMIELMSNTIKHAYNDEETMNRCWYCYSEYNRDEDSIAFTFVDTGEGIPSTVRKNFAEKLDILKIYGEDKYVISALNGKFRTSTLQSHRGKGLPKIRDFCFNKKIQDMRIITNKADVTVGDCSFNSTLLTHSLKGTLYYWKIYKSNFKGEYDEY